MPTINVRLSAAIDQELRLRVFHSNRTITYIVIDACTDWLNSYESQPASLKRESVAGERRITAEVPKDLYDRIRYEYRRRRLANLQPATERALVEGALIEWFEKHKATADQPR